MDEEQPFIDIEKLEMRTDEVYPFIFPEAFDIRNIEDYDKYALIHSPEGLRNSINESFIRSLSWLQPYRGDMPSMLLNMKYRIHEPKLTDESKSVYQEISGRFNSFFNSASSLLKHTRQTFELKLRTLNMEIQDKDNTINSLTIELEQLKKLMESDNQAVQEILEKNPQVKENFQSWEKMSLNPPHSLSTDQETILQLVMQIKRLNYDLRMALSTNLSLRNKNKVLQKKYDDKLILESHFNEIHLQNTKLTEEKDFLNDKINLLQDELKTSYHRNEHLELLHKEALKDKADITEELDDVYEKCYDLINCTNELLEKNSELKDKNKELEKDLEKLRFPHRFSGNSSKSSTGFFSWLFNFSLFDSVKNITKTFELLVYTPLLVYAIVRFISWLGHRQIFPHKLYALLISPLIVFIIFRIHNF